MNREEAQFILEAYRPNSADAHDPQFQEALALARQDPELARWFAEQQALDRAFAAKIRARPISPELKPRLLLARTTGVCTPRWRRPAWLAAAAGFALLVAVAGSLLQRRARAADLARFRTAMAAAALDMSRHSDVMGLDAAGYKVWLAEHRGERDFVLPPGLVDHDIAACKIVEWQEHRVTMLCFKFGGRHVDVFVIDAADLPALPLDATPAYVAENTVTTAAWRRGGKIYLVAATMLKADLQQLL